MTRSWRFKALTLAQYAESRRGAAAERRRAAWLQHEAAAPAEFQGLDAEGKYDLNVDVEAAPLHRGSPAADAALPRAAPLKRVPPAAAGSLPKAGPQESAAAAGDADDGGNSPARSVHTSIRSLGSSGSGVGGGKEAVVIPEAARFAALKSASLKRQLVSPEVLGMAAFFTVSVVVLQLYLGAPRLCRWVSDAKRVDL